MDNTTNNIFVRVVQTFFLKRPLLVTRYIFVCTRIVCIEEQNMNMHVHMRISNTEVSGILVVRGKSTFLFMQ